MIFKAVISSKAHPEYGAAAIPFPIPDSEYDQTIGMLEDMGIGDAVRQDCRVDELDSLITWAGGARDRGRLTDLRHKPAHPVVGLLLDGQCDKATVPWEGTLLVIPVSPINSWIVFFHNSSCRIQSSRV